MYQKEISDAYAQSCGVHSDSRDGAARFRPSRGNAQDRPRAEAMQCSDMHSATHHRMANRARHSAPQSGTVEAGDMSAMQCMRDDKPETPLAQDAHAQDDHNHGVSPPRK